MNMDPISKVPFLLHINRENRESEAYWLGEFFLLQIVKSSNFTEELLEELQCKSWYTIDYLFFV